MMKRSVKPSLVAERKSKLDLKQQVDDELHALKELKKLELLRKRQYFELQERNRAEIASYQKRYLAQASGNRAIMKQVTNNFVQSHTIRDHSMC